MTQNEFVDHVIEQFKNSNHLIIGGYPCCGKTTISKLISEKIQNCIIIESEHWLHSEKHRINNNLSGTHPLSYNIKKSLVDIENLIESREINLPIYSHDIGAFKKNQNIKLNDNTKIIFDGVIFTLNEYFNIADLAFLLIPENYETWLECATIRDIQTRYYSKENSIEHNQRKYNDMEKVINQSRECIKVHCSHSKNFEYIF